MKKLLSLLLALMMVFSLAACGNSNSDAPADEDAQTGGEGDASAADYHIGIVTGSVSQSEDDRRGAEAFQAKYGEDMARDW